MNQTKLDKTKVNNPAVSKIEVLKEDFRTSIKNFVGNENGQATGHGMQQKDFKFEHDTNDVTDEPSGKLEKETEIVNDFEELSFQQTNCETIGKIESQVRQESISANDKTESKSNFELPRTTDKSRSEMEKGSAQTTVQNKSELEQAYEELCDPLLPVRGHGLIRITRMIQRKDSEVVERPDAVFKIFLENLDHTDSYIYLAAVSGLTALSDLCPDLIVSKLCVQFANFDQVRDKKGPKRKVELRMKIGEVLVKASRCLGKTFRAPDNFLSQGVFKHNFVNDRGKLKLLCLKSKFVSNKIVLVE